MPPVSPTAVRHLPAEVPAPRRKGHQALTARQAQILTLIQEQIARCGAPPTRAEIAGQLGFRSANAAEDHLRALARKGMIELSAGTSRGIRLLHPQDEQRLRPDWDGDAGRPTGPGLLLPLIGRVAAGAPILAEPHIESTRMVDGALFHPRPDFLLKVRGLSMRDAGILEGDLLAVRRSREARHGQIVVARISHEVTVKRLDQPSPSAAIRLLPANPDFEPITIAPDESDAFAIEGIVVGLIRPGGWAGI